MLIWLVDWMVRFVGLICLVGWLVGLFVLVVVVVVVVVDVWKAGRLWRKYVRK